jgi:hypothetical protein
MSRLTKALDRGERELLMNFAEIAWMLGRHHSTVMDEAGGCPDFTMISNWADELEAEWLHTQEQIEAGFGEDNPYAERIVHVVLGGVPHEEQYERLPYTEFVRKFIGVKLVERRMEAA